MKINTLKQFKSYAGRHYDHFERSGLTVAGAIARLDEKIHHARSQVQTLICLRNDIRTQVSVRQVRFDRRRHTYNFQNGFDPLPPPQRGRRRNNAPRAKTAVYRPMHRMVGNNGGRPR